MLVVESVIPGGPADGALEPGDVLVRLNGAIVTEFLSMEELLDDSGGWKAGKAARSSGSFAAADTSFDGLLLHRRPA